MVFIKLALQPRVIAEVSEPGKEEEYTVSIVSSGYVHSTSDPLLGKRYFYGNPELTGKRTLKKKGLPGTRVRVKIASDKSE